MTNTDVQSRKVLFFWNNWPLFLLMLVALLPATKLGIAYVYGLLIIAWLSYTIFLLLQLAGMSAKSPGNLVLSICIAVVILAFLALVNAANLAVVIAATFLAAVIAIFRVRKSHRPCWIPQIHREQQGLKFGLIAASILGAWAWFQISLTIFSGNTVDSNKLFSDVPLLAGLTRSIADGDGLAAPFLDGFQLRYHWLSYGFSAWISDASGIDPIVSTFGITPFLGFLLSLVITGALAANISISKWAPLIAISALALVGGVGLWQFTQSSIWQWGSPSTIIGGAFGLAVTLVVFKPGFSNMYIQALMALILALGAALSKVSMGVVLTLAAFGLLAYLLSGSRLRFQVLYLPLIAIPIGTAIGMFVTFSGAGGTITVNPIWSQLFGNGAITFIEIAGSEGSFVAGNVFLWAGIVILIATRAWTESVYIWAVVAGVAGQIFLLLLSAPAANERFFAIAGMTIATPILATMLLRIRLSRSMLTIKRLLAVSFMILISSAIIGIAAWNEFFNQRPLLMIGVMLSLSLVFASMISGMLKCVPRPLAFLTASALFFIPLSVIAPQILKFLDEERISTSGGLLVTEIIAPELEDFETEKWRKELIKVNEQLVTVQSIAIWRTDSVPEIIGRWALYDLTTPIFVSTGVGAEELTSSRGKEIADERRDLVNEVLMGSEAARSAMCSQGVGKIIMLSNLSENGGSDEDSVEGQRVIGLKDLGCSGR